MTYTPTVAADTQMHDMYHNRHSSGIELGKAFLKTAMKWCYEVPHISGAVIVVDRKLSAPARKVVVKVLEVVNKELGSVDISEEELWTQRAVPGEGDPDARKCDRYKAFMHVLDGKCVGVCMAERIGRAYKALPNTRDEGRKMEFNAIESGKDDAPKSKDTAMEQPPTPTSTSHEQSTIILSRETYPAIVGVSRIWTSRTFRRKGIAKNLLECVMNQFIYGMEIERTDVAFSQPTEMGTALAKSWFGNRDAKDSGEGGNSKPEKEGEGWGWRVYIEE
jgi:N-acetyltransferase